jgi:large subunit ribosomal protein L18
MAKKSRSSQMNPRKRSKLRIRAKVAGCFERPRISVFRSSKHTYAQLILDDAKSTVVSASTLDGEVRSRIEQLGVEQVKEPGVPAEGNTATSNKSVAAARIVGLVLAERSLRAGYGKVVFDRNGFAYWGRVRAVAEGAREGGLVF